jgi:hypothetical protein
VTWITVLGLAKGHVPDSPTEQDARSRPIGARRRNVEIDAQEFECSDLARGASMNSTSTESRALRDAEIEAVSGADGYSNPKLDAMRSTTYLWYQGFDGEWRRREMVATD